MAAVAETHTEAWMHADLERLRVYDDASTWFAEALEGSMRTTFEYRFDGQELYGRDGRALGPIFDTAVRDAEALADSEPNLLFELRRRCIEKEEYLAMLALARGQLPNTMVVVSDFPPELMDADQDVGGYDVSRRQAMLRVIAKQSDGSIRMTSQSLDRSSREGLEAIYGRFGVRPQRGELLGQRIHAAVADEALPYLTSELMASYDQVLAGQYGGTWHAGRRNEDYANTYAFVCAQQDLLELYVDASVRDRDAAERIRYSIAAALQRRFDARPARDRGYDVRPNGGMTAELQREILFAAAEARAAGRTFSGCGVSMIGGSATERELEQSGYGGKAGSARYEFNKKMFCVVCQRPPKEGDKPKMCGPCGICRHCDGRLKKKIA